MHATINPTQCIGCTKCLAVCPPGAIIGARRMVHGVMAENCHACGLCMPVCPVSCISWSGEGSHPAQATTPTAPQPNLTPNTLTPNLPPHLQQRIAAARAQSNTRYTQNRGPLNQPKALRNKQAKP